MLKKYVERLALPKGEWTPPPIDRCHLLMPHVSVQKGARQIVRRSKSHNSTVLLDPTDMTGKQGESDGEHNAVLLAIANPAVKSFICQAPAIEYPDDDGVIHEHYFDLLLYMRNGERRAVVVKPKRYSTGRNIDYEALAERLAAYLPDDFADHVDLLTRTDMPAWLISNASLIRSSLFDPLSFLHEQILDRAREIEEPVTIRRLIAPFGRGLRAVARLMYGLQLAQVEPGLITQDAIVVAVSGRD